MRTEIDGALLARIVGRVFGGLWAQWTQPDDVML